MLIILVKYLWNKFMELLLGLCSGSYPICEPTLSLWQMQWLNFICCLKKNSHKICNLITFTGENFSNFSCVFLNPNIFSDLNANCSNLLDMRNLPEQVKKAFCYQKLFWPFTVWINCSSYLKCFSRTLEQFFLTVGQNNFGNKIPFLTCFCWFLHPNYCRSLP